MEQYRQSTQAANVEEQSYEHDRTCEHNDNHVSALETLGGHRNMGHWELSHVSTSNVPVPIRAKRAHKTHEQIMDSLVAQNPFHILSEAEPEDAYSEGPKMCTEPKIASQMRRTWKLKQPEETGITTSASLS